MNADTKLSYVQWEVIGRAESSDLNAKVEILDLQFFYKNGSFKK